MNRLLNTRTQSRSLVTWINSPAFQTCRNFITYNVEKLKVPISRWYLSMVCRVLFLVSFEVGTDPQGLKVDKTINRRPEEKQILVRMHRTWQSSWFVTEHDHIRYTVRVRTCIPNTGHLLHYGWIPTFRPWSKDADKYQRTLPWSKRTTYKRI